MSNISSAVSTPRSTRSRLNVDQRQSSTEVEKSTPYPLCYGNLLAGRSTTGVSTSTTPGQMAQPGTLQINHHKLRNKTEYLIVHRCFMCAFFFSFARGRTRSTIT